MDDHRPDDDAYDALADQLERERERQRVAALKVEKERRDLLAEWLAAGGTETEFDEAWPTIHEQLGKSRLQDVGDKARGRSLMRFRKPT